MVVKRIAVFLLLMLSSCGIVQKPVEIVKTALLAPFEGRYREVGYDALYAVRLAIADSGYDNIDLLAIDDGGSVESAIDRAHAIQNDPTILATLVLGIQATDSRVQVAFGEHPVLIIGHWNTEPTGENVSILASSEIDTQVSEPQPINITTINETESPIIGSEILTLKQIPMLREDLSNITVLSSASLPDAEFIQRYIESDGFAPQPGLLATLTYDATRLTINSIVSNTPLRETTYDGMNGIISFDNAGYWLAAPVHEYRYENGILVQAR